MPPQDEVIGFSPKEPLVSSTLTREMMFLAAQATEGKVQVLPAQEWSLHYPADAATRAKKLQGLLDGRHTAEEVAGDLTPDAVLYAVGDILAHGQEYVSARIRDISAFIAHYDYPRFARFVESMRGHDIPVEDLVRLYSDVTQTRVQKKLLDAYGYTGREQLTTSLKAEASTVLKDSNHLPRSQKVLKTLKLNWLSEELGAVSPADRDAALAKLSGDERALFDQLQSPYRDYVRSGDQTSYERLLDGARAGLPKLNNAAGDGEVSESMQQLEEELEQYTEQAVPPGSPDDPAIPPEDQDEYHTPPPVPGESTEKTRERPIFEIQPPLGGYYASGRKSYFDIESKTWSKKKQLTPYTGSTLGEARWTITGAVGSGCTSLPLPNGYALEASSLHYSGARPDIARDETGCMYLVTQGPSSFSVAFGQETAPVSRPPIAKDTASLYRGSLSAKTEAAIARFTGTPTRKAEQARQYLLANHFYPGGGDLKIAQALQYKLRSESSGDTYLQNIDASEYLECYSANTKFIALVRNAGVPARLVVGHKVEGAKNGTSSISQSTGHAWSEIWDGSSWRRFDATPSPKPEDKKQSDTGDQNSQTQPADEAHDDGVDAPSSAGESTDGTPESAQQSSSQSGNPLDQLPAASDSQMQQSQSKVQEAKQQLQQMEQQQQQLDDKLQQADTFKDLAELQKEIEASELFDDLKQALNEKLDAKEEQMKDTIKEELDHMVDDGFMDEQQRDALVQQLEQKQLEALDRVQKEIEQENRLYTEFERIREEITPLVEQWFRYFYERLPPHKEVRFDEDSLTRQGSFDKRAMMTPRNLITGTVKHPREIISSLEPRFMASLLVDVSGSMAGEKLHSARKLLVFYCELFSRIAEVFGYIRFSIDTFSDSVTPIKGFAQEYDTPQRYDFADGTHSTVKVRLMQQLRTQGGTNMLDGIKRAAEALNQEFEAYPDYASALYFVGDGGDTRGNTTNIQRFFQLNDTEQGFGTHMYSAILLGNESQRRELAQIFGDEHTNVAPDFDELIEQSMKKFDEDIEEYLRSRMQ